MVKKTIKNKISKSSKRIYTINKKLIREINKRSKGRKIEETFKTITKKIENNGKIKPKTIKKNTKRSIRSGTTFKKVNKKDKIIKLSNDLSKEIKKVLNGKTKSQNNKKLDKLRKDLFILGNSSKTKAGGLINSFSNSVNSLQNATENFVSSKTGSSTAGKVVGVTAKVASWVAASTAGLLVADYVTDELVESFDDCPRSGFFDGPHILTDNKIIYDNLGNW